MSLVLANLFARLRLVAKDDRVGAVFPNRDGNPHTESGFKTAWARPMVAARAAGVVTTQFPFHDLRAYYVTQHKAQRGKLPDLNRDAQTTARMYDRSEEVQRRPL